MKTLSCGEIMAGCTQTFRGETEQAILAEAGRHAAEAHGLTVTEQLVEQVRAKIRDEDGRPDGE
jgi:predicted small metal-binding protein